ncbi:DUF6125 family protein [Chloroflexota bacterium]
MQIQEMNDYSGPFIKEWKYEYLSKETLIKLLVEFGRAFIAIDGFWYTLIENRFGLDLANELDSEIWEKIVPPWTTPHTMRLLNISGDNVETLFKVMQNLPDATLDLYEYEHDLKNPNHGIFTVYRCPGLSFFERKRPERILPVCVELEPRCIRSYAAQINPDIKVDILKLPPRKSEDEIACQWEFTLESKK